MPATPDDADVVVVGAGIVGLATARAVLGTHRGAHVIVVDKEDRVAAHQSGHNSGVVHTGIYYRPGSHKATTVAAGRAELIAYCRERGLAIDECGKVIVAVSHDEVPRLRDLEGRARANGVMAATIGPDRLRELEPHAHGVAALHVPGAAIVDFADISRSLARDLVDAGAEVRLGTTVRALRRDRDGVVIETDGRPLRARAAVNCAGLQSDLLTLASGTVVDERIVAFRGEYHELIPSRRHLVRNLIYPVPDPRFPFLGVHFTRMVDGSIHAGPNAVLALAREGYRWRTIDVAELRSLGRSPALRALGRAHWRTGGGEVVRSVSRRAMVQALRRLVPDLGPADLVRAGAGVRAQAVRPDGTLLDDFAFAVDGPIVHVLNAPSPAATASLAIGRHIVRQLDMAQR